MPFPDYTSLPQYANILHIWKLEEESGVRYDAKGDCDLADNNTVLYGSGKIGNGADFELDNDEYLSATSDSSSDMDFTDSNFSISFWWKPEVKDNTMLLSRSAGITTNGWYLYYDNSGDKLYLRLGTSGAFTAVSSNTGQVVNGSLKHYTIVRNGTTGYIYVNGADQTLASDTLVDAVSSNANLYIGRDNNEVKYEIDGILDEFIVWNVALSPAEVSTLYNWYSKVGLSGAISFSGDLSRKLSLKRILIGSISFIGTLQRKLSLKRTLEGIIPFVGTLQRKLSLKRTLEGAIPFIGTLSRKVSYKRIKEGTISFIGTLTHSRIFYKLLEGAVSFVGTLERKVSRKRLLEGSISFVGILQRKLSLKRLLEGAISFIGVLNRKKSMKRLLEGSISFVGTLSRKLTMRRILEGKLSFIGTLGFKKVWSKVSRAVASFTKLIRDTANWTKEDR